MLRTDRLTELVAIVADALEAADLEAMAPDSIRPLLKLGRSLRIDPLAQLRAMAISSLRALPEQAAADPARTDQVTAWLVHTLAWLDGQIDEPPPSLRSTLAIG